MSNDRPSIDTTAAVASDAVATIPAIDTTSSTTTSSSSAPSLQKELEDLQAALKQMVEQNRMETDMLLEANASSETKIMDLEMQLRQLLEQEDSHRRDDDGSHIKGSSNKKTAAMEDSQSTALTELTDLSEQSGGTWNNSGMMGDTSERSRRGSLESTSSWIPNTSSSSYRMDRRTSYLERAMSSSLRSLNLETAIPSSPSSSRQGSSRVLNDSLSSLHLMERVSSLRLQHQRQQQQQQHQSSLSTIRHRRRGSTSSNSSSYRERTRQPQDETSMEEKLMNKLALVQLMHKNELEQLQRQLEHHASAISSLEEALIHKNQRMERLVMNVTQLQRERDALCAENQQLLSLLQRHQTGEGTGTNE
jgi:chromosome segregation ATPase